MIAPRIAVQTSRLGVPIRQALHIAGDAGADGVQFDLRTELAASELSDTGLRQLRKMLDDRNLRVATAAFRTRGYAEPRDLERRLQATVEAMKFASKLQARVLTATLGELPPIESPMRATLAEALTMLAGQGDRLGVQLALDCADTPPTLLAEWFATVPEGSLGVNFNPAEVVRVGRRPPEVVQTLGQHVLHLVANDAVRGGGSTATRVELGRGTADLPEILGALEQFDYRGWITVEARGGPTAAEETANAVRFLRSL